MGNDVPRNLNYFKRTDLLRMWDNVKPVLKDKDLMDMLLNFDIEGLNDNRVTNIRAVFANDVLMTFNVLIRESVVVAHLFEWINGVLEYFEMLKKLKTIGITQLYEKIHTIREELHTYTKIYKSILMPKNEEEIKTIA